MSDPTGGDRRIRLLDPAGTVDASSALHALDRHRVVVDVGELTPASSPAAAVAIAVAARLFAHVEVRGAATLPPANPWGVDDVAAVLPALGAVRPHPTRDPDTDVVVAIGDTGRPADLGAGGGPWDAHLALGPTPVDLDAAARDGHAIGLHAAAALALNELMKRALVPVGLQALALPGDRNLRWNLIDYRLAAAPDVRGAPVEPRPVMFAGCGSLGGTTAGLLAMMDIPTGEAHLVDAENFDPHRNPFRYPLLVGGESGEKAAWAAGLLTAAGWQAATCSDGLRGWVRNSPRPGFDGLVLSTVDTLHGRLYVADLLARDVCSLGVAGLALHAQRERLGDGYACSFCDFVQASPPSTQADVTASQLGLPVGRVLELTLGLARLTAEDLAVCVAAGAITEQAARSLNGNRIDDLIARSYAEVGLGHAPGVAGAQGAPPLQVAAPQVSWIAAVIAAAEIVKYRAGLPCLDRRVDVDLLGLPQGFARRQAADGSGRCLCASPHRRGWMGRMYA